MESRGVEVTAPAPFAAISQSVSHSLTHSHTSRRRHPPCPFVQALKYVSFPVQTLAKSAKMIPVMVRAREGEGEGERERERRRGDSGGTLPGGKETGPSG